MTAWTFETLAAADRDKLEEVLRAGQPPEYDQLEGYLYCGWNHERVSRLTGEKFKKAFRRKGERTVGYNEVCHQDGKGYRGEWRVKLRNGQPVRIGYYRVALVKDEPPRSPYRDYTNAVLFDYNVYLNNTLRNLPLRVIRDIVVLPNPGDHELMLGKAYLQLGFRWINFFYSYFVLGHRTRIEHEPW
jgi:hypothetical protein